MPLIPTGYERLLPPNTQVAVHASRRAVAQMLSGRVLDLGGAASHLTMHRRSQIQTSVVLDSPDDPRLVELAEGKSRFDHVVAVCALSRTTDLDATLAAVKTVLAPGGRLHFVEPVSTSGRVRTLSRLARPVVAAAAGFHLERNVVQEIRDAGFTICDIHRERSTTWKWPFQHIAWGSARISIAATPSGPDTTS
ncbi:MAG TPA: hypothetical protein VMW08_02395 [Acidimicrobiales bacterium]|nr:hypothetical protein [Acidimicrobiales bacterium]